MDRELLSHFPVVLAVARRGGFAAAAAELGMSPSAVSHAVKTVEDRLGMPLLTRTTRSVALTEAGVAFLGSVGPAMSEIQEAIDRMRAAKGRVTGLLKLNAPRTALAMGLTSVIAEMSWRHPELTIEVTSDDALVDIVSGGFDAGVRLGEMIAQDMVAVRLTSPFQAIMVAAPSYVAARGEPRMVADLVDHNCIGYRFQTSGGTYAWELIEGGADVAVEVQGSVRVTDSVYARELALAGIGIAYLLEPLVRADIREGRLRWLMPHSAIEEPGLFLYFPRRASMAPKLRAFIDVATAVLKPSSRRV